MRQSFHCSLLVLLLAALPALAADPDAAVAVVVGHNASPDLDRPALRYADDDAVQYAELFDELGCHTHLLTELDEGSQKLHPALAPDGPPSRAAIREALAAVNRTAEQRRAQGGRTTLYFVYTGHGDVRHGEGFITLKDGPLSRDDFYREVLEASAADSNHVIIDACKSYYLVFDRGEGSREPYREPFDSRSELLRFPDTGFLLSTSSAQNSHEWEGFQAGVFSHEVRSGLRGGADIDGNGTITYRELAAFVYAANQGIKNERYRPRFLAVPPVGDDSLTRTAPDRQRSVALDRGQPHHLFVEDRDGNRLADVRLGAAEVRLFLPHCLLYVRDLDDDLEYRLDEDAAPRLSEIEPSPPRSAIRGAADEALRQLFRHPLDRTAYDSVQRSAHFLDRSQIVLAPSIEAESKPRLPALVWTGIGVSAGLAILGGGLRLGANHSFGEYKRAPADEQPDLRTRVEALDYSAYASWGLAGAVAVTTLILYFVLPPDDEKE